MRWSVALMVIAACGGAEGAPPDAGPDALTPGPHRVMLFAYDASYLIYRDADGPWQVPLAMDAYDFALDVTDDYEVVASCGDADTFDTELHAWTWADGAQQFVVCAASSLDPPPPVLVTVTGRMLQPGRVAMGASANGATSPWSFSLDVSPGTHDLVGVSADRALIRRSLPITVDTSVPDVDVDTDGVALDQVPLTINGTLPGDQISTSVGWLTSHDVAHIDGTATTALAPPSSLLEPDDHESIFVKDEAGPSLRDTEERFSGGATTIDLMPVLTGVTYATTAGAVAVSWDTLPAGFTQVDVVLEMSVGRFGIEAITASPTWIEQTGARSLDFAEIPASLSPTWTIDPTGPYVRGFEVFDENLTSSSTSLSEGVNGAPLRRSHPFRRVSTRDALVH